MVAFLTPNCYHYLRIERRGKPMSFANNLIKLRRKHGLSQEGLGEVVGVSRQTVSKWELGVSHR